MRLYTRRWPRGAYSLAQYYHLLNFDHAADLGNVHTVTTAIKRADYLLKISDETLADTDGEAEKGFKRFIRKVPVGPVLVLFAWNVSFFAVPDLFPAPDMHTLPMI